MLLIPPAPLELSISVDNILFCFAFFLVCIIPVSRKKKSLWAAENARMSSQETNHSVVCLNH